MMKPRPIDHRSTAGERGGNLSSWLSDALRLRQNALAEALRRRAGPSMVGHLVNDIHRLTAEYEYALYVEKSLRSLAGKGSVSDNR